MDQQQIHIVKTQVAQGVVKTLFHAVPVAGPDFGRDKQILTLHGAGGQRAADSLADLLLIAVDGGAINVADTSLDERVLQRGLDLAGTGLPSADTKQRHGDTIVKSN